ncbi:hypothetical protein ACRRTK_022507 [Alexandromys fortis]
MSGGKAPPEKSNVKLGEVSSCDFTLYKTKPFENGQYLDIYGITRDQAGEYECSAQNDVSFPDVKKVRVVVNSESASYGLLLQKIPTAFQDFYCRELLFNPSEIQEWKTTNQMRDPGD